MYLLDKTLERAAANQPVKVALIGAGKFGSMFLSQVPSTAGLHVSVIADLDPERARQSCRDVGWSEETVSKTRFTDDVAIAIDTDNCDVVIEATGNPAAGVSHAIQAIEAGLHIVMVNVEADVLAGPLLAKRAREHNIVYSMAYGDQPALTCELVEWARTSGFEVVAAGKGTKYLPQYHDSTPDTVWEHYGTKSALEMAAIANATGLKAPTNGLQFPPAGMDDLAHVLRPDSNGGILEKKGQVEVVSSLERDGRPVFKDLRWGVYVVIEAPNDYAASCFVQYGMNTDDTGRYSAMYKPFHLIGMELNTSIFSAALLNQATGSTQGFQADVVATSKRHLQAGEVLDGEGGSTVWGKLYPAERSLAIGGLPIGLAHQIMLKNDIKKGDAVTWDDVNLNNLPSHISHAVDIRRAMESEFS